MSEKHDDLTIDELEALDSPGRIEFSPDEKEGI